jgi:hypothetical protein
MTTFHMFLPILAEGLAKDARGFNLQQPWSQLYTLKLGGRFALKEEALYTFQTFQREFQIHNCLLFYEALS